MAEGACVSAFPLGSETPGHRQLGTGPRGPDSSGQAAARTGVCDGVAGVKGAGWKAFNLGGCWVLHGLLAVPHAAP